MTPTTQDEKRRSPALDDSSQPLSTQSSRSTFPYYPGCTLKTTAQNFEDSALATAAILGIDLVEIPRWNCCGVVSSLVENDRMHHVAPLRNIIRTQDMIAERDDEIESRLVTLCSMCTNTLRRTNLFLRQNPEDLEAINDYMSLENNYEGDIEIVHLLEILRERGFDAVADKVSNSLEGLKVAPYYGCMLLRPKDIGIDDPENPTIQEDLIEALRATVIDTPYKKMCCGSYQTVQDRYAVAELAYDILTHAQREGAEVIVTACPLCAFNLDDRQKEVRERYPEFKSIPVLYFTQLIALAFGLGEDALGFELNSVDPRPLLMAKGLLAPR